MGGLSTNIGGESGLSILQSIGWHSQAAIILFNCYPFIDGGEIQTGFFDGLFGDLFPEAAVDFDLGCVIIHKAFYAFVSDGPEAPPVYHG